MSPLAGLRVVELARVLAGPTTGQTLADLGADVIKVESPEGDETRRWGPPFIDTEGEQSAAYFHSCNRGKRSIVADFATERGREIVRRLAARSDVLVENFKVGELAKFGLDYEPLSRLNPRLIYCSVTGFGQTGPYAKRAGYDFLIQGMSGVMDITGEPDGPPEKAGIAIADLFTGLYGVIAIEAALIARNRTGRGQRLDLALFELDERDARQSGDELSRFRPVAQEDGQRPHQSRTVPDAAGCGWLADRGGRQRRTVHAALRGAWFGEPCRRPALCDQSRPRDEPYRNGARA